VLNTKGAFNLCTKDKLYERLNSTGARSVLRTETEQQFCEKWQASFVSAVTANAHEPNYRLVPEGRHQQSERVAAAFPLSSLTHCLSERLSRADGMQSARTRVHPAA
jgi:hypothetical protein